MDGTLLGPDKRVSPRTREAFRRLHATGEVQFALVSSRMPSSLRRVESAVGVPCWKIAYDGALVQAPGASEDVTMLTGGIERAEAIDVLEALPASYVGVYAGDTWICNQVTDWSRREITNTDVHPTVVPDLVVAVRTGQGPLHKIMFRDSEAHLDSLRARLTATSLTSARWFSNGPTILEFLPNAASKANALQGLSARLGVTHEQVTVFGDGANDVPMFQMFPNSVAVENAISELKQHARHRTVRGDADGVARFLLSELEHGDDE